MSFVLLGRIAIAGMALVLVAGPARAASPVFAPGYLRSYGAKTHTRPRSAIPPPHAPPGSLNVITAEPGVPRPHTRSCTVPLFTNDQFANYSAQSFGYAPPAACPGPWAKVVFEGNFSITAGVQYDRTADAWIGNSNVYFGTTAEPLASQTSTWHVERDVTDMSALFKTAQPGEVEIFNIVSASLGLNGVLGGSADLVFYSADFAHPAPATPDVVLPLSGGPGSELTALTAPATLSRTFTFPANTVRAYLDVFAQSQGNDEFWYTCSSNDIAPALDNCGNTAFRETEIAIDGTPAGVAPVYPWIYTGGIDPFLWQPIPGNQTLDFKPYRVDLTPFAALLSNGTPHTVAIGVYNSNNNFSTTGTLYVFEDPKTPHVTGALTADTLAPPSPTLRENFTTPATAPNGTETISSARSFTLAGYVTTSHGRITTTIQQDIAFSNTQHIVDTATLSQQKVVQRSTVSSITTTLANGIPSRSQYAVSYPLNLDISTAIGPTQDIQTTTIAQGYRKDTLDALAGTVPFGSHISEETKPTDALAYSASTFTLTGNAGQASTQTYVYSDSRGGCYSAKVAAANSAVTYAGAGPNCHQ